MCQQFHCRCCLREYVSVHARRCTTGGRYSRCAGWLFFSFSFCLLSVIVIIIIIHPSCRDQKPDPYLSHSRAFKGLSRPVRSSRSGLPVESATEASKDEALRGTGWRCCVVSPCRAFSTISAPLPLHSLPLASPSCLSSNSLPHSHKHMPPSFFPMLFPCTSLTATVLLLRKDDDDDDERNGLAV
jgi:hypothetical protein